MKLTEVVDKKLTKPIGKTFIGIIFIGFILLTVLWLPTYTNIKDSKVDILSTPNNSLDINSLVMHEENKELKEVDTPTNTGNDNTSTFDFKEAVTWFIGVIQSFLIILLTIKKVFGKGV